jgi:hypothetical protein
LAPALGGQGDRKTVLFGRRGVVHATADFAGGRLNAARILHADRWLATGRWSRCGRGCGAMVGGGTVPLAPAS